MDGVEGEPRCFHTITHECFSSTVKMVSKYKVEMRKTEN